MANFVRLGIVLVVVLAVLIVDITPKKTAASKAASKKVTDGQAAETASKVTSHKGSSSKTAASKVSTKKGSTKKTDASKVSTKKKTSKSHTIKAQSQDVSAKKPAAQTESIQDVAPSKVTPQEVSVQNPAATDTISTVNSFINSPQAASMLAMLQTGKQPSTGDLLTLMLPNMLSGAKAMNPALTSLASALNETALALNASKDGKLSTGQMMICSNKILTALGNATDTPKENMPKLKGCMATGMRTYNSSDLSTVFGTLNNCSQFLGNGTKSGDVGVMAVLSAFLPPGVGGMIKNPGIQDVMKAVGGIVSQVSANKGKTDAAANIDAPALINSLGSMMKGAGVNLDMNAVGGIVSQVAADQGKKDGAGNKDSSSLVNSLDSMAKGAGLNIDFGQMFSNFKFGR